MSRALLALQQEMKALSSNVAEMKANRFTSARPRSAADSSSSPRALPAPDQPASPVFVGATSTAYGLNIADSSLNNMGLGAPEYPSHDVSQSPLPNRAMGAMKGSRVLPNAEIIRLMKIYQTNVQFIYPFLDMEALEAYTIRTFKNGVDCETWTSLADDGQSIRTSFDLQFPVLKLVLACALVIEGHGHSDLAARTVDSVEGMMGARLRIPEINLDELVILIITVSARKTDELKCLV